MGTLECLYFNSSQFGNYLFGKVIYFGILLELLR